MLGASHAKHTDHAGTRRPGAFSPSEIADRRDRLADRNHAERAGGGESAIYAEARSLLLEVGKRGEEGRAAHVSPSPHAAFLRRLGLVDSRPITRGDHEPGARRYTLTEAGRHVYGKLI